MSEFVESIAFEEEANDGGVLVSPFVYFGEQGHDLEAGFDGSGFAGDEGAVSAEDFAGFLVGHVPLEFVELFERDHAAFLSVWVGNVESIEGHLSIYYRRGVAVFSL